jgi:hypothetical protein
MKKITVNARDMPSEPLPEIYKESQLPKNLSIHDLEQLQVLKEKLKTLSLDQKESAMNELLNDVIEYLDVDVENNKKEIVQYVMWKLERFVLKKGAGQDKRKMAVNILKRLFHNDANITGLYVDSLMHDHKQLKTLGRLGLRMWRYFVKNE